MALTRCGDSDLKAGDLVKVDYGGCKVDEESSDGVTLVEEMFEYEGQVHEVSEIFYDNSARMVGAYTWSFSKEWLTKVTDIKDGAMKKFRYVKMVIVDNEDKLEDGQAIIWESGSFLTSESDEQLWFNNAADINKKLIEHNVTREKKELEPIKYSDCIKKVLVLGVF